MRKIVFGFCALTVATWLLNLGFNPPAINGRGLTHEVFFLNGVLAWGLMAMAIVIAARPAWLEKVTATPLDELYKFRWPKLWRNSRSGTFFNDRHHHLILCHPLVWF